MGEGIFAVAGVLIGAAVVLVVVAMRRRGETAVTRHLLDEAQKEQDRELAASIEQLKTAFAALSREALSDNTDDFLKLAKTRLDKQSEEGVQHLEEKKKLIDARLTELDTKLHELNRVIQAVERHRAEA